MEVRTTKLYPRTGRHGGWPPYYARRYRTKYQTGYYPVVCERTLRKLFNIPKKVNGIWLVASDTYSPNMISVRFFENNYCVSIAGCPSQAMYVELGDRLGELDMARSGKPFWFGVEYEV